MIKIIVTSEKLKRFIHWFKDPKILPIAVWYVCKCLDSDREFYESYRSYIANQICDILDDTNEPTYNSLNNIQYANYGAENLLNKFINDVLVKK